MRLRRRVDANQAAIVAALRAVGVHVTSLASVGNGCPDLLCSYHGRWYLLEVKDGTKPPSARRLTPDEARFHVVARAPVYVVTSAPEALRAVGART